MKFTHLFFDLDRTLWDFDSNSLKSLTLLFQEFNLGGIFTSPEDFSLVYNRHNDKLWDDYRQGRIDKTSLRSKRFYLTLEERGAANEALAFNVGERYMEITPKMDVLFPNTISVLEYLTAQGYQMNILTNGFLKTQETKLHNSQLDRYFNRIYSSEEIGINKPRQEIFHWAVSSVNAKQANCVMIGDDFDVDIMGAIQYGIAAIWFNRDQLVRPDGKHQTIGDLNELRSIL